MIYGTYGVSGYNGPMLANSSGYQANNQELVLILTSSELSQFPVATNTVNQANARNPQKTTFLYAQRALSTEPGLGWDAVYRDPWGMPYIVTIDLDQDGWVQPALYRLDSVGQKSGYAGHVGLARQIAGGSDNLGLRRRVAIWSMGPARAFTAGAKATGEAVIGGKTVRNSDNVLSWDR
ncbi:MAG: hypothetical protein ACI9OD_003231 [Limisphaerales bacterium]|jgi:hypothetical protein